MIYSPNDVITDWLTITCRPENTCHFEVTDFLLDNGAFMDNDLGYRTDFYFNPLQNQGARIQITEAKQFVKISATGTALAHLRQEKLFDDYLRILSGVPHKVTRLDTALDVLVDTPIIIKKLRRKYPDGQVKLLRKALPVSEVIRYRDNGVATGTYYIGRRGKSRAIARVYDKQMDLEEKHNQLSPPLTRYELEFGRKFEATLKDASEPYLIFWNHAQALLLKIPPGLKKWEPNGAYFSYQPQSKIEVLPAQVLRRRIENSLELKSLFALSEKLGPRGTETLLRYLRDRVAQMEKSRSTVEQQNPE